MVRIVDEFRSALMLVLMCAVDAEWTASLSQIPIHNNLPASFVGAWYELLSIPSALKMEAVTISKISVIHSTTSQIQAQLILLQALDYLLTLQPWYLYISTW
jgi:hypothetical protein